MFKLWTISTYFTIMLTTVATDYLLVINSPDSLKFEESSVKLPVGQIRSVLNAIVGESALGDSIFSAFKITNIFKLPKLAFIMTMQSDVDSGAFGAVNPVAVYPIKDRTPDAELHEILDFYKLKVQLIIDNRVDARGYTYVEEKLTKAKAPNAKLLVQELRDALTSKAVKTIMLDLKKRNFIGIRLNDEGVVEFEKIQNTIINLKPILKDFFFGVIVYSSQIKLNGTQELSTITVIDATESKDFNLAPIYYENYAAVFNIIFWFMVAFSLSLFASILALINMDPGRDSIIYRMTATRSKKDI